MTSKVSGKVTCIQSSSDVQGIKQMQAKFWIWILHIDDHYTMI